MSKRGSSSIPEQEMDLAREQKVHDFLMQFVDLKGTADQLLARLKPIPQLLERIHSIADKGEYLAVDFSGDDFCQTALALHRLTKRTIVFEVPTLLPTGQMDRCVVAIGPMPAQGGGNG